MSYEGFAVSLPHDYLMFYLGKEFDDIRPLQVNISVEAAIKRWGMLRKRGWNYFQWIDSFAEALERFASK